MTDRTDAEKIMLGERVKQFMDDPIITEVMADLRSEALEQLAAVSPLETEQITRLQAEVSVIDSFREALGGFILEADDLQREKPKVA